ncbi:MAG TPA: hypothetical protein PLR99_06260 [Polyangiaceae bacterium]|nr:hypothetical protein [Polyangiaceae bacterium]
MKMNTLAPALGLALALALAPRVSRAEEPLPPPPPPPGAASAPSTASSASASASARPAAPAAASAPSADPGTYGPHGGWFGISLGLPAGGAPTAGITYFLSDTSALKLDLGLDVGTKKETFIPGFSVEVGYRAYIAKAGNLSPFLQPGVFVAKPADGKDFADTFTLQLNVGLGAEYFFSDHLSVSGQTGLGVGFRDKFKTVGVTTGTSGIYGNFYW